MEEVAGVRDLAIIVSGGEMPGLARHRAAADIVGAAQRQRGDGNRAAETGAQMLERGVAEGRVERRAIVGNGGGEGAGLAQHRLDAGDVGRMIVAGRPVGPEIVDQGVIGRGNLRIRQAGELDIPPVESALELRRVGASVAPSL